MDNRTACSETDTYSESAPLLNHQVYTGSTRETRHTPARALSAVPFPPRPPRATTTTAPPKNTPNQASPAPLLSRPTTGPSASSSAALQAHGQNTHPTNRPSLLRRATDAIASAPNAIASALELPGYSYAEKNRPAQPTYWTDYAHQKALTRIWDSVAVTPAISRDEETFSAQLATTEERMLEASPELKRGTVPLTRAWTEYVLGKCMRPPFNTSTLMSRTDILAAVAGPRMNWGPY
ncbi:hypothetical protein LTR37_008907 [Vermiconidia calcicola]|uniref:Uncharacterized protein n=1 Tax=Vermiconidia calcicola TaxID=1690605 RepID=A0ACC3NAL6_9PEZI|nr:hypothetical protein LTR37_008907 [Vermiconidia calcicola]